MIKVDIAMTATLRPKVIRHTLESFCKNLFTERNRYRLIINVDPIGENIKQEEIVNECKRYFGDVIYNLPSVPSFPLAVKWTWEQSNTDFVFHLEDDWLLTTKLNIDDMISILNKDKSIACLRLPKKGIFGGDHITYLGGIYDRGRGNYYITKSNSQFGLNPVLIRKEFVKEAVPIMSPYLNPEKQFRPSKNEKMNILINKWFYGLYCISSGATVLDNGTSWRDKNKFKKPESSFLVWEKSI